MPRQLQHPAYFVKSAQPLTSLLYVLPILGVYELGVLCLGPSAMRNGADVWLRALLDGVGLSQYFLLPLLTCGWLIAWHYLRRDGWSLSPGTLGAMLSETTLFALVLAGLGLGYSSLASWFPLPLASTPAAPVTGGGWSRTVGFMGAGVYEEVLFRLLIIPAVAHFLKWLGEPKPIRLAGAAIASSLLFAAAHYEVFTGVGEPFSAATFVFRFVAGLVFAAIFIFRGFGIAAGSHTLYDLLVGVLIVPS